MKVQQMMTWSILFFFFYVDH